MRVRLHWLTALLLALGALTGYHFEVLILVGSLAAHELAHLMVAWVLGLQVEELLLTPFGGMARLEGSLESDPQAETSVALAGPFQSFFLAGLAQFMTGSDLWDQQLVRFFFDLNANLAFFNLIPALPLDGGRALRGLLAQRWGYRRVTRWMSMGGRVIGLAMSAAALLVLQATGQFIATPLLGGLYLAHLAGQEASTLTFRSYRHFLRKRDRLASRGIVEGGHLVARTGTRLRDVLEHLASRRYHLVLVVDAQLHPLGTLHEAELMDAFAELGPEAAIEQVLDR